MKNFRSLLLKRILSIVRNYSKAACEQVRQQWGAYSEPNGNAVIDADVKKTEEIVSAVIYAYGQKAWILEYGSGSEMARDNPFLMDYMNTFPDFNKARMSKNMAILGRPKGTYHDLDGVEHKSNGSLEGRVLEGLYQFTKNGKSAYQPHKPRYIIRHVLFGAGGMLNGNGLVRDMMQEIHNALNQVLGEVLASFPKKIQMVR